MNVLIDTTQISEGIRFKPIEITPNKCFIRDNKTSISNKFEPFVYRKNLITISKTEEHSNLIINTHSSNKINLLSKEINEYTKLTLNWGGDGYLPLFEEVANKSLEFFKLLDNKWIEEIDDLYPNPHGTLMIVWQNTALEKLSLEMGINNFSYFVKFKNKQPILYDGKDFPTLTTIVTSELCQLFGM